MTEPTPDPTPTPDPAPAPTPAAPAPAAPALEATKVEELPEWAQKVIRETRKEAADNRGLKTAAEQKQQELMGSIAQALGLKPDDTPPDPAALQQTLGEREGRIAALQSETQAKDVELAAWRAAARQNARAESLLDSRAFVAQIAKLDPAADDFTAQLDEAVKKAVESNPGFRLHLPATPGQVGLGVAGGPTGSDVAPGMGRLRSAYATSPTNP